MSKDDKKKQEKQKPWVPPIYNQDKKITLTFSDEAKQKRETIPELDKLTEEKYIDAIEVFVFTNLA